ncbi:hypothetical protein BV25DRAFT_1836331 [Artomyces pyxidatus]|uniref:Uncharacterized protein n=1 Tax=Artomyces pyxidatus TaxID=48021 RepID=A0ACB8TAD1_9AGAM|nr:hypothetical protein BV25DRAFT_1836331 [Artomyces pyxidatus]
MSSTSLTQSPRTRTASLYAESAIGQFDLLLASSSQRAAQYEHQIKELEDKLSEDLSNCRAIESLLRDAFNGIKVRRPLRRTLASIAADRHPYLKKRNYRRADKDALRTNVPHIDRELEESMAVLTELEQRLPEIRSQVAQVRLVYDSGRRKAEELVQDLKWLNNDFYERWRTVIFTKSSPVSWQWKAFLRALFAIVFTLAVWISWVGLSGAYRAHRQRLVWGERLMS